VPSGVFSCAGFADFARKSGGGRDSFAPNDVLVKIQDLMAIA